VDSSFGKVLGFACGRRTIKTAKLLWQQIKHLPTMGYGTGHAEVLREFHSTRQALRIKDLHHTNRITQLPTEALSSKAPSQNALLQQIKNDVGSFFETPHP
jgi:IS1 family transposase